MRAISLTLLVICMVLVGCRRQGVRGNGTEATEQRSLGAFTSVDISGTFSVTIRCGEQPGATVTADNNLLALIRTEVRGSTLHIYSEKDIEPRADLRVEVTTPSLSGVTASGVASINIKKAAGDRLNLQINGAASITAEGAVRDADFSISGAGKLSTEDLHSENVHVAISGAGKADVYASGNLDVDVSGAGTIHYSGDPTRITKHISGVGFVSKK